MDSPGHRENLLSPDYTEVGLGLALGTPVDRSWGATYTTDFGAGAQARPPPPSRGRPGARARRAARRAAPPRAPVRRRQGPQQPLGEAARGQRVQPHGAGTTPLSH